MLAHKAEEEGVAAVEFIAGNHADVNYDAVANNVYTWPEIASVGATEEELKGRGATYKVGKFPWIANGRARSRFPHLAHDGQPRRQELDLDLLLAVPRSRRPRDAKRTLARRENPAARAHVRSAARGCV
jgi:hypothetical protein